MFDQPSKITAINSFREPETGTSANGQKRKPHTKHAAQAVPVVEPTGCDGGDEHELDTLA
ncbi:MAG: hypothetical protein ACRD40_01990 [Candidatus Acidiferrales bacterium]